MGEEKNRYGNHTKVKKKSYDRKYGLFAHITRSKREHTVQNGSKAMFDAAGGI